MKRNSPSTAPRPSSFTTILLAALLTAAVATAAGATTITWSNAAGGAWSNAANWSPASVPGSGDVAVLPALSGAYTVTLDTSPSAAQVNIAAGDPSLDVNGQSIASVGAISNDGTIVNFAGTYSGSVIANHTGGLIVSADNVTISVGPSITNDGTIKITTGSQFRMTGGTVVSGTGTLRLDGGTISDATGTGPDGGRLRLNSGQTLNGVGTVTIGVDNYGTILVNDDGGQMHMTGGANIVNYGTVRFENHGAMKTEGSGILSAGTGGLITTGSGGGSLDTELELGRYGTIGLQHGGAIELNGGDLTLVCEWLYGGPILNGGGGGALHIDAASIEQSSIEANTDVYVTGNIGIKSMRIDGKLHVPVYLHSWTFGSADTAHVSGSGSIELEGGSINDYLSAGSGGVFEIEPGFTVHGTGTIDPPFVNNGTVDLSGMLKVPAGAGLWRNNGLIKVGRGGMMLTGADVRLVNAGRIQTTDVNGALQIIKGATIDNRGGVITASAGAVKLGNQDSYGNLIGGRLESASGGEFVVARGATLNGVTVGSTGSLRVLPNATALVTGQFSNLGTVHVTGTGRISTDGAGVYLQKDGVTSFEGGSLLTARDLQVEGGMLKGFGTITANVRNGGTIAPDAGATPLRIAGNYTQLAGGEMQVTIAGSNSMSRLDVSGTATLAGGLSSTLAGGFVPQAGQSFKVLTYAALAGAFDPSFAAAGAAPQLTPVFADGAMSLLSNGTTAVGDPIAAASLSFSARNTAAGTSFVLALPNAAEVKGRVYDAAGREVAVLANGALAAGVHTFAVNRSGGVSLASGIYFARVSVTGGGIEEVRTARAIVIR